jgi:hypothetical protein
MFWVSGVVLATRIYEEYNQVWQAAGGSRLLNILVSWLDDSDESDTKVFTTNMSVPCYLKGRFRILYTL